MAKIWTFFYGSYMNPTVLREVGLSPDRLDVARLHGYDIRIAPRANVVPSAGHAVYGVLAQATHDELDRLYAHARTVLGEIYLPHPVLVETLTGDWRAALCYIAAEMDPGRPDRAYLDRIIGAATDLGFPAPYIARLESERGSG